MPLDILITGANRGIGLGFTKHYLARGDRVIATYRTEVSLDRLTEIRPGKFTCLRKLQTKYPEQLRLQQLDVTSEEEVSRFAETVEKLDEIILNAGIKGYLVPGTKTKDHPPKDLRAAIEVNTLAPNHIWSCFYRLISKTPNARVIYMGSLVALPKDNTSGNYHPYRVSKTASHHMMWNLFLQLIQDWRSQAVETLKNDLSLTHFKEQIRVLLPDTPDQDLQLEKIETALMTTPLMSKVIVPHMLHPFIPDLKHTFFGKFETACLKEWLESVFPEVPLKTLLLEKILKNLTQHYRDPEISTTEWILQILEKTSLIDPLKGLIEKALTNPSSIKKLTAKRRDAYFKDLSLLYKEIPSMHLYCESEIEAWAFYALNQVPSFDKSLKDRIIDVVIESPCIKEWREKMLEILSQAPVAAAICAGWVKTDMGGPDARLSIHDSTNYMSAVIEIISQTKQANGLLMYDGTIADKYPIPLELEEIFYAIKNRRKAPTAASSSSSS